jgi:UDP-3-O-[3-hydroxymyristoyl] glucosamine N-acyltransferase
MNRKDLSLAELSRSLDGRLEGDPGLVVSGVAEPSSASGRDIVVLRRQTDPLKLTGARPGVFVAPEGQPCPEGVPVIRVADPETAFAAVLGLFAPGEDAAPGVHPSASVHPGCLLGAGVSVAEFCVLRQGAVVGQGTVLHPGVFVGRNVIIGRDCVLHPHVAVHDSTVIGERVVVKSNAVIGGRGFGFFKSGGRHVAIPQIGRVRIGSDVDIGSNVCIDRATIGETVVEDGAKIDNLVQVAHNVSIGENAIVIAQTGLSGSVRVGRGAILAGQAGIADHIDIGENAVVAAKSGVLRDVAPGEVVLGVPALPVMRFKRIQVLLGKLQDLFNRVDKIEKKIPGGSE